MGGFYPEKIDWLQDMEEKLKNQNWNMLSSRYLTIQRLREKVDLELKWEVKDKIQIYLWIIDVYVVMKALRVNGGVIQHDEQSKGKHSWEEAQRKPSIPLF